MMNFSGDDSVITYLRQQKLMLLELVLLMLSIMILALEGGNYYYYQLYMAILLGVIGLLTLWKLIRQYYIEKDLIQQRQKFIAREVADEALQGQNKLLAFLHQTAMDIMSRQDVVNLLETIVKKAAEITGASTGSVLLFNEDQRSACALWQRVQPLKWWDRAIRLMKGQLDKFGQPVSWF